MGAGRSRRDDGKGSSRGAPTGRGRRARAVALSITALFVLIVVAAARIASVRPRSGGSPALIRASSVTASGASPLPAAGVMTAAAPGPASASGAMGAGAPSGLDAAAKAVGFTVTTGPNVGVIENLPADTTLLAPSTSLLAVDSPAPDFTLRTPEGTAVRLSDLRGKTVLLEFFATWCPHCQAEAPHLLTLLKELPASKVAFLSVNADSEDAASIHAYTGYFGLPWPALMDPGSPSGSFHHQGALGPVSTEYGVSYFPTFYVISASGRIAWRADREQPDALLLARLRDVSGS